MSAKKAETPETTLEAKIRECAAQCGLTDHEAHAAMASGPVGAWGDGVALGKILDFMKLIMPYILPLILKDKPTA